MDRDNKKLKDHKTIQNATKKFHILFEVVYRQKQSSPTQKAKEELFLLEINLINSYFHILAQDIETILAIEPSLYDIDKLEKEKQRTVVIELARSHVIEVLGNYEHVDISRILKIASLTDIER